MGRQAIKRTVTAASLIALALAVCVLFESYRPVVEDAYFYWFSKYDREPNPNYLTDYPSDRSGLYQFNSETILESLDRGEADVFSPLSGDPDDVTVAYENIAWGQSDFLRVANALSQKVWHEPLDLNSWGVFFTFFEGQCSEHFGGFYAFDVTYYKTVKMGWEVTYVARHIDLTAWNGVAEWAGDGEFSAPFMFSWRNVGLAKVRTTAEQAVRIADENGGDKVWVKDATKCTVYVDIDENHRDTGGNWLVDYYAANGASFSGFIDPLTGQFQSVK